MMDVAEIFRKGRTTFMGLELIVERGTLLPRPETELLARAAIGALEEMGARQTLVIDMCCGAGNLACAIAHFVPGAIIHACDLNPHSVDLAGRNSAACGLQNRVSVHEGDLFSALDGADLAGAVDLVVCNPPYISETRLDRERSHLLECEPRDAFAAGAYGISIHQRVVREALAYLRPGGVLAFEVGDGQDRQVTALFRRAREYEDVHAVPNEAGEARVVTGTKVPAAPASPRS